MQIMIKKLNGQMTTLATSILKDPNVAKHMFYLHDKYCVVPADKTSHNIICVCKLHYKVCLIKELSNDDSLR